MRLMEISRSFALNPAADPEDYYLANDKHFLIVARCDGEG